jgi:hypothetical protein
LKISAAPPLDREVSNLQENNGTKADNRNGTKADNTNSTTDNNTNGTKANKIQLSYSQE